MSRDASELADRLEADPMVADDIEVAGYDPGAVGRADEMGMIIVDRTYRGPARPLQGTLQERAAAAGWSAISVRCRSDGRGFVLTARRWLDERVALLSMSVLDEEQGRRIAVEVTARVRGGTDFGSAPGPVEPCE